MRVENECGIILMERGTKGAESAPFVAFFGHANFASAAQVTGEDAVLWPYRTGTGGEQLTGRRPIDVGGQFGWPVNWLSEMSDRMVSCADSRVPLKFDGQT